MLRTALEPVAASIAREILALLFAASCGGCDLPEVLLCEDCRVALAADPMELRTPGGLVVRAALRFDGVAARCIRRLKDDGETLLARPLGAALAAVLDAQQGDRPPLVPVPTSRSSFRRRGFRVPDLLIRRAGERPLRALAPGRARSDQRGLGAASRRANVDGSMRALVAGEGRRVIVVDDVVTSGATLDEAALTLRRAGFEVIAAVALAATPRHSESRGTAPATRRK